MKKYEIEREIKFRVWTKERERTSGVGWQKSKFVWKMKYNDEVEVDDDEVFGEYSTVQLNLAFKYGGDASFKKNEDRNIYMEWIGLTDKKGIEIYEKDIIEDNDGEKFVVFFNGHKWDLISIDGTIIKDCDLTLFVKRYKVVGNIYENEDLLK